MSALARYSRPVDGTIPVQALLYDDERLLASQDGLGLYDGPNKSPSHQVGTVHISSHRLFFISGAPSSSPLHAPLPDEELGASLILPLEAISHTESYAGFFKSSPKVTLHLRRSYNDVEGGSSSVPSIVKPTPFPGSSLTSNKPMTVGLSPNDISNPPVGASSASDNPFESWECEICGYRNSPGLSPSARSACGLCGMPRVVSSSDTPSSSTPRQVNSSGSLNSASRTDSLPVSGPQPSSSAKHASSMDHSAISHIFSKSLPSSSASTPPPLTVSPPATTDEDGTRGRRRRPSSIACSVCTFLNHPYLRECEMCGTPLPSKILSTAEGSSNAISDAGPTPLINSKSAPNSRPVSPAFSDASSPENVDERERYIRLSFRKGGDKAFYAALKTTLQQKKWEVREASYTQRSQGPSGLSGINAILQNIDTTVLHTERGMSDAFEDLEALMSKAQDMVRLAKGLNEQLAAASRSSTNGAELIEPEEATFIRSSLGQLGLNMKNTAVTADMSSDERKYLEQLAVELAGVLEGGSEGAFRGEESGKEVGMMRKRGIVGLDEVWGGWNRARGVALISPAVISKVLPFLPRYTVPPISTRMLASGLRVLHTPSYSTSAFSERLFAQLLDSGPLTTTRIAIYEELSIGLAEELVNEVEERGDVCRDDPTTAISAGAGMAIEMKWWPNAFIGYTWDEQID